MYRQDPITQSSILIVDDAPDNLTLLKHMLGQDGYEVRVAPGGRLALQSVRASPPDLILLDVRMPDMDGFAVCRALKADPATCDIPVIFLTALDSAESEWRGLELGAVDYLTKPFGAQLVRTRVRNHLRIVHQRRLLERWALLDALTELPNRRRFDEALDLEWARCGRSGQPLSLAMLDLDHFKGFNDTHGHPAGDRALCAVARAVAACLSRPGDLVARYGGEELVMLMPETDLAGAATLAERARRAVAELRLERSEVPAGLTLSVGGATLTPTADRAAQELVERADRALYRAKAGGRDRVEWDGPAAA